MASRRGGYMYRYDPTVTAARFQGTWKPREDEEVIGVRNPTLVGQVKDYTLADSGLTQATTFGGGAYWADIRPDAARVELVNGSGGSRTITEVAIRGKPVTMTTGGAGYVHDEFVDHDDIEINGDKSLRFGNEDVTSREQLEALADFLWKYNRTAKHIYTCTMTGMVHWIQPGQWYTLNIGASGTAEHIDAKVECLSVRSTRSPGEVGTSSVVLREIESAWKTDSNARARFVASSGLFQLATDKLTKVVGAQGYTGNADVYCDGNPDNVEINAAIAAVSSAGGGVVMLPNGVYVLGGSITPKENVTLMGFGKGATILEINTDAAIIYDVASGDSGSAVDGFKLKDMTLRATSGAAHHSFAVNLRYHDGLEISGVEISENIGQGFWLRDCALLTMDNIDMRGLEAKAILTDDCPTMHASKIKITDCTLVADHEPVIFADGDYANFAQVEISNISNASFGIYGIYISGDFAEFEDVVIKDISGSSASTNSVGIGVHASSCTFANVVINNVDNPNTAANQFGVHVADAGDSATFSSLIVTGCSGTGVKIEEDGDNCSFGSGRTYSNGTNYTDSSGTATTGAFQTS